ncbi:MAG TPA: outer membrane beta-barrel protein [Vicinamibacterales bacterium]|nr:outer membrane beta-barrel protein [Vicinamibacterales bacterium]
MTSDRSHRRHAARALVAAVVVFHAVRALAQPRVPDREMWGVGGEVGAFLPQEDGFGAGLDLQALAEYYLTPRTSIRTAFGWNDPSVGGGGASRRTARLTLDVLYNWEAGRIHPFVGGGFGAYFLQPKIGGRAAGESRQEPGFSLAGGFEYFAARTFTIKAEARYHAVLADGPWDMDGLALTIGFKQYF